MYVGVCAYGANAHGVSCDRHWFQHYVVRSPGGKRDKARRVARFVSEAVHSRTQHRMKQD